MTDKIDKSLVLATVAQTPELKDHILTAQALAKKIDKYPAKLETEEQAAQVQELYNTLKKHISDIDKERLAATKPYRDGVKAFNAEVNQYLDELKPATGESERRLLDWTERKEAEARAAAEKERKEAEAEAEKIRASAAKKYGSGIEGLEKQIRDIEGRIKRSSKDATIAALETEKRKMEFERDRLLAEQRYEEEQAERLQEEAAKKPVETTGRVTGVGGSQSSVRRTYHYELEDIDKVPEQYLIPPEERLDKGRLRKAASQRLEIPGLRLVEKKSMTTRSV